MVKYKNDITSTGDALDGNILDNASREDKK
jgi:hypothetical protein